MTRCCALLIAAQSAKPFAKPSFSFAGFRSDVIALMQLCR
jgi:hypothetical protein